ncbi:MAG TPA: DUF72 domain-containing protein [Chloroflexota bacterium]|jgi:uncharacterized protein YecE (DUF72 family)|nr:DUF72 domain-containing protein [Chloroflexota bacterium]
MNPEMPDAKILVGTCNWADHEPFYPKGLKPNERLGYYSRFFPIVEVDSTFYRLMPERNFQLWAERTPDDFVFDVKAYRTLTRHGERHEPGARHETDDPELDPRDEEFKTFNASLEPLRQAGKLRAVLFQFPPWVKASERNREYLEVVREYMPDHLVAVEFRHRSWLEGEESERTFDQLHKLGFVYTAVDQPQIGSGSIPPLYRVTNPALAIVRFHGRNAKSWYVRDAASSRERFDYLYKPEELAEWVPAVDEMASGAREVHLLMNNNAQNYAVLNARDMMRLLGQTPPPLDAPAAAEQTKLPLES